MLRFLTSKIRLPVEVKHERESPMDERIRQPVAVMLGESCGLLESGDALRKVAEQGPTRARNGETLRVRMYDESFLLLGKPIRLYMGEPRLRNVQGFIESAVNPE